MIPQEREGVKVSKLTYDNLEKAYEAAKFGKIEPNMMVFYSHAAYKRFIDYWNSIYPPIDEVTQWIMDVKEESKK